MNKKLTVGELKRKLDKLPQGALVEFYEIQLEESEYQSEKFKVSLHLAQDSKNIQILYTPLSH